MKRRRYVIAEMLDGVNGLYEARVWVAEAETPVGALRKVHSENPGHGRLNIVDPR